MRDEVNANGRERVCAEPVSEWKCLEVGWDAGDASSVARRVPGCPVRMSFGGVGGGRILGMTPEPACGPRGEAGYPIAGMYAVRRSRLRAHTVALWIASANVQSPSRRVAI